MTTRATAQTSALDRLLSLPAVFRGADLTVRFSWSSKKASQYLYRWKQRGLVDALGGHSDVYANLLVSRHPDWERALLAAMPTALLISIECLRRAGWTTQIPQRPAVAVNVRQPRFTTDRFDLVAREPGWFATVCPGVSRHGAGGLPWLHPAWALADMLRTSSWGDCGLWPDDVDLTGATADDRAEWLAACAALGVSPELLSSASEGYAASR